MGSCHVSQTVSFYRPILHVMFYSYPIGRNEDKDKNVPPSLCDLVIGLQTNDYVTVFLIQIWPPLNHFHSLCCVFHQSYSYAFGWRAGVKVSVVFHLTRNLNVTWRFSFTSVIGNYTLFFRPILEWSGCASVWHEARRYHLGMLTWVSKAVCHFQGSRKTLQHLCYRLNMVYFSAWHMCYRQNLA